jgi:anti-sigma regulatory factor (Ser/Thr protein kinase)
MPTREISVQAGDHVVQFYQRESELARTVGSYLAGGIRAGGAAIVIATEAHRQAFELELDAAGIDVPTAVADRRLVLLDAAQTLGRFMPDGQIDGRVFREMIGNVVRDAGRDGRPVHAYGEMVALLWDAGNVIGAIELEKLWNELGRDHRFALLCGYHTSSVSAPEQEQALQQVCHLHSHVLDAHHDEDLRAVCPAPAPPEVSREFPAIADTPRAARRFVAKALQEWGHPSALLSDAELVLSELVTNAVIHAGSPVSVSVRPANAGVHLRVHDASPAEPRLQSPEPMQSGGRGMHVVAALARRWGVESTTEGKTVWAELGPVPAFSR